MQIARRQLIEIKGAQRTQLLFKALDHRLRSPEFKRGRREGDEILRGGIRRRRIGQLIGKRHLAIEQHRHRDAHAGVLAVHAAIFDVRRIPVDIQRFERGIKHLCLTELCLVAHDGNHGGDRVKL